MAMFNEVSGSISTDACSKIIFDTKCVYMHIKFSGHFYTLD